MDTRAVVGLGVLFVAAGCATSGVTAVAVRPISDGRPTERTEYQLADPYGRRVGRITLVGDRMIRAGGAEFVEVSFVVDNWGARSVTLPLEQIYLTSLGAERLPLLRVNDGEPMPLVVPEGSREPFHLRFALPSGVTMEQVRAFQLHWAVSVDDRVPAVRSTAFAAIPSMTTTTWVELPRGAPQPGAMNPMNDMIFHHDETLTRSPRGIRVQRRAF